MPSQKIAYVKWTDPHGESQEWHATEDIDTSELAFETVGFVTCEDSESITLSACIQQDEEIHFATTIPRVAILEMRELGPVP